MELMDTAPKDGSSVRVPESNGYTHAFFQDGFWWWHSDRDGDYACGPNPKGWYAPKEQVTKRNADDMGNPPANAAELLNARKLTP